MEKPISKAAAKANAEMIHVQGPGLRTRVLEELKISALNGIYAFEEHVAAITAELAILAGYPRSTTASRMQRDGVSGASTFYTYVLRLKPFVLAEDWDGVRAATSKSLTSAARPRKVANSVANVLAALKLHHHNRELTDSDYKFLGTILKGRKGNP